MRILITSPTFAPLIGGVQTITALQAEGFAARGHEVTVCTPTPGNAPDQAPYRVVRKPSARELIRSVRWSDVVLQNTLSIRLGWPLLGVRRPVVVAHHMWMDRDGPGGRLGRLKHWLAARATNIAVSEAMARSLDRCDGVIPNAFADDLFVEDASIRDRVGLVFVGRLIQAKGLHVLIEALTLLPRNAPRIPVSVIGDGPEETAARDDVRRRGLEDQVHFLGPLRGRALVQALNRHRVMVVPSVWEEPFGIVALEGLACGLVPIVARSGGLPDAVGDAGVVVPKSDAAALASEIHWLYGDASRLRTLRARAAGHLERHTRGAIAERYLHVLAAAVAPDGRMPGR